MYIELNLFNKNRLYGLIKTCGTPQGISSADWLESGATYRTYWSFYNPCRVLPLEVSTCNVFSPVSCSSPAKFGNCQRRPLLAIAGTRQLSKWQKNQYQPPTLLVKNVNAKKFNTVQPNATVAAFSTHNRSPRFIPPARNAPVPGYYPNIS